MKRYNIKRYFMVKNGKVFDTSYLFPHVECYYVEDDKLYSETIDGTDIYMGVIVCESDSLKDIEKVKEI